MGRLCALERRVRRSGSIAAGALAALGVAGPALGAALDAVWSVAGVFALLALYPAYALLTGLGRRRHAQEYRRLAREAERQGG